MKNKENHFFLGFKKKRRRGQVEMNGGKQVFCLNCLSDSSFERVFFFFLFCFESLKDITRIQQRRLTFCGPAAAECRKSKKRKKKTNKRSNSNEHEPKREEEKCLCCKKQGGPRKQLIINQIRKVMMMTYWKVQHTALMMKSDELTTVAGHEKIVHKKMPVCKFFPLQKDVGLCCKLCVVCGVLVCPFGCPLRRMR